LNTLARLPCNSIRIIVPLLIWKPQNSDLSTNAQCLDTTTNMFDPFVYFKTTKFTEL